MIDHIPEDARPYEVSVLLVYSMGITEADDIRKILHYESPNSVYMTLRKYRDVLPELRNSAVTRPLVRLS